MLINAVTPEEVRVAIVDGPALENFQVESTEKDLLKGNIYRGIVHNVQPSLNAAFIDIEMGKDGFLSFHDLVPEAWHRKPTDGRARIESVLEKGRELVVQVVKDGEGQKGPALTTSISLAGRYLVLTPYDDTRGVSRKVEDEEQRRLLKEQVEKLAVPSGAGFIIRTNALDQTKATLTRDFNSLLRLWKSIQAEAKNGRGPRLLNSEHDILVRVLRDYLDAGITEVLIDSEEAYERAGEYVRSFMPRGKTKLIHYDERMPLFSKYDIETQIARVFERSVKLKSGGSIVIDRTEALIAIDVNSGKSNKAGTQEETALNTNLEAAEEIARQLRLRDIGGLIVVDFIDMRSSKSQARVEKTMRDAMKTDKARSTVGRISENGLLEINRQRLQQALTLRSHRLCPTCEGTGRIASPEMVGLNLLRKIEAKAAEGGFSRVRIQLHPELADAFQNGRRQEISRLERDFDMRVEVIASNRLHRPEQEIEWFARGAEHQPASVERQAKQKRFQPGQSQASQVVPGPQPAPEPQASPAESGPAAVEAPAGGTKRKRRRRRRGERGDEGARPPQAESAELLDAEIVPAEAEEIAADAAAAPVNGEGGARKRRRGGRRGRGKGSAAKPGAEAGEQAALPPLESIWVNHPEGEAAEPRKRRHRRRGHVASNASAEPAAEE